MKSYTKYTKRKKEERNLTMTYKCKVYLSAAYCRTYSGKIEFSAQKVNTIMLSAYNETTYDGTTSATTVEGKLTVQTQAGSF